MNDQQSEVMTDHQLAEIQARCEKASPGPWYWLDTQQEMCEGKPVKGMHTADCLVPERDLRYCKLDEGLEHEEDGERQQWREFLRAESGLDAVLSGDGDRRVLVSFDDAALISHAQKDISSLLSEVHRLRRILEANGIDPNK